MDIKDIYKIWAPQNNKWSRWVRPVPFVAINTYKRKESMDWVDYKATAFKEYIDNAVIFVDLYGEESIEYGIALAKTGYIPIPIFNGTDETPRSNGSVETCLVESYLISGARRLKDIKIDDNAKPAFLLDVRRLRRFRDSLSTFDNSWDLYNQDIPSIEYLKNNGIEKIIVVSEKVQRDLRKIFFKYQDAGIKICLTNGFDEINEVKLKKTIKERFEKEEL